MRLSLKVTEHAGALAANRAARLRQTEHPDPRWRATSSFTPAPATSCTARPAPPKNGYSVFIWREQHGITGHIIAWNYPMQILGRSVGGALAAGNVCVAKPAEDTCLSPLRVAELAVKVGLPPEGQPTS